MKEAFKKIKKCFEEKAETYKNIRRGTYCRRTETDDCDSCRADHYLDARLSTIKDLIEIVNQVEEEYKSLLTDTDLVKALRCLGSQTADGDCYETLYNMQHMGDEDYKPMRCGACESETKICCPYHQKNIRGVF